MSFRKTIDAEVKRTSGQVLRKKIRQANTTGATIGDDAFVMKNGYLYTVVRAISARVNQNYDGWPSDELKQSYRSFVGKPVFVNHQNSDPTKARGRVVAARYFENGADKGIECIMEVDAQRFSKLAHEIRTGGLDSVSMGAEAGHTICSMCGNKATDTHDMCDHVKFHKGEHLMKNGKPQLVYETCHKLGFFELSYVFDPADETAVVSKVIQANIPGQGDRNTFINHDTDRHVSDDRPFDGHIYGPDDEDFERTMDLLHQRRHAGASGPSQFTTPVPEGKEPRPSAFGPWDGYGGFGGFIDTQESRTPEYEDAVNTVADTLTQDDYGDPRHLQVIQDMAREHGIPAENAYWDLMDDPEGHAKGWKPQHSGHGRIPYNWGYTTDQPFSDGYNELDRNRNVSRGLPPDYEPEFPGLPIGSGADAAQHYLGARQARTLGLLRQSRTAGARRAYREFLTHLTYQGATYPSIADAVESEWGSLETWGDWLKKRRGRPKDRSDEDIDRHVDLVRNNDERALTDRLHEKSSSVEAMIRQAFGETQAPEAVDTLRSEEEGSEEDFHAYVETPEELSDPNLDRTQQLDREQEAEGLDGDRKVEDIEGWEAPDHAQNELTDRQYLGALMRQADGGIDSYDPWAGNNSFNTGLGRGPQPQGLELAPGITNMGGGGGQKMAPGIEAPHSGMTNGSGNFADDPGDALGQGKGDFNSVLNAPAPDSLPGPTQTSEMIDGPKNPGTSPMVTQARTDRQYLAAMGVTPVNGSSSPVNERRAREENPMARKSSLASRRSTAARGRQHQAADESGHTDNGDTGRNDQGEQEEVYITQTPASEPVDLGDGSESGAENALVARMQANQQQLLRDAARWQQLQANKAGGAPVSRTARIAHKISWMEQRLGRRLTAEESATVATSVPETADVVNPELSGTDDQSLRGSDFQPADPNAGVQTTQPKDASVRAFQAFDQWFTRGTGKRPYQVAAAGHEGYVLRQAKRFAEGKGAHPQVLFPTLGTMLRQAKKDGAQGGAMRRRADSAEELRAPSGRVDVEAPTSDTVDERAISSQFPLSDFGNNAGDNLADPDLSTDSVTWAPGEGKKEGAYKRASAASAVRCADLFVEAGLRAPEDRYNLISMHEGMRAGQVADRIAMLELFKQAREQDARRTAAAQRRVASGISRGASPVALPPGMGSGQFGRVASTQRVSAMEDQSTDSLLFM